MGYSETFRELLSGNRPLLALAPMQDVTDLPFWKWMMGYGGPDVYWTEYFRVHKDSRLERKILRSVTENPTGRPVVAQMIGNDAESLVRNARELERYDIAAVDLNLGCPAPVVYRKCAGGGLLRDLNRIDGLLGALRDAVRGLFTVKTRVGFGDADDFDRLLGLFEKHGVDVVSVHGRTVKEGYRSAVHYDLIAFAVKRLRCPVIANGNVYSAQKGVQVLEETGARGLMIGRGAIRNPWMFEQFRQIQRGEPILYPKGREVFAFIESLYEAVSPSEIPEIFQVQKMKKYLNFIGLAVDPEGKFLHAMRRVETRADLFSVCKTYLDHEDRMTLEPFQLELAESDSMRGEHL